MLFGELLVLFLLVPMSHMLPYGIANFINKRQKIFICRSILKTTSSKDTSTQVDEKVVNINSIRADKKQVWIPEIEIINRVNDFSPVDEKQRQLKINSNGEVRYTRAYRIRSMLSSSLGNYPYDVQESYSVLAIEYKSESHEKLKH